MPNTGQFPVLVVDDEPSVAEVMRRQLAAGLPEREILTCTRADLAIELVTTMSFSVVLCDLQMPGLTGIEILAEARRRNPATVGILVTGQATKEALVQAVNQAQVWKVIEKPWAPEALVGWVRDACRLHDERRSAEAPAEKAGPVEKKPAEAAAPKKVVRLPPPKKAAVIRPPKIERPAAAVPAGVHPTFAPPIPIPKVAARYVDLKLVHPGGLGAVYRARDTAAGRMVALKVIAARLAADETLLEQMTAETTTASRLNHPNLARVLGLERNGPVAYLVEEYVEGQNLRRVVARHRGLPATAVAVVASDCAAALAHAFERGLVHRHLRTDRLMLDARNHLKVVGLAFGRAVQRAARLGMPHVWHHLCPEIDQCEAADPRMDVYSLAISLHELLTGNLPDHAGSSEPRAPHEYRPVASSDLPAEVREVLDRGFARAPEHRWPTPTELARRFTASLQAAGLLQAS